MLIKPAFNGVNDSQFGLCYTKDYSKYAYIPIQKNAHTHLVQVFESGLDWHSNYGDVDYNYRTLAGQGNMPKDMKFIVALRDPLERWVSGVAENLANYSIEPTSEILKYVFGQIMLDDHTEPQTNFIYGLDTNDCIFFKVDNTLDKCINHFFNNVLKKKVNTMAFSTYAVDRRTSHFMKWNLQSNHKEVKNKIISVLHENLTPKKIEIIKKFYKQDYELIDSIEFYNVE